MFYSKCLADCLREEKKGRFRIRHRDSNGDPLADSQFRRIWTISKSQHKERTIYRYVNGQAIKSSSSLSRGNASTGSYHILWIRRDASSFWHTYITTIRGRQSEDRSVSGRRTASNYGHLRRSSIKTRTAFAPATASPLRA